METTTDLLDQVTVATPCTARWEEMVGDDKSRFCSHCSLNVFNLSAMAREEAEEFVANAEGRVCIRLYRRADGTVITQDCPVGLQAVRQRIVRRVRNVAATVMTLAAGMIGVGSSRAYAQRHEIMGDMIAPPPDTVATVDTLSRADTIAHEDLVNAQMIMGGMRAPRREDLPVVEPVPVRKPITLVQLVVPTIPVVPVRAIDPVTAILPVAPIPVATIEETEPSTEPDVTIIPDNDPDRPRIR